MSSTNANTPTALDAQEPILDARTGIKQTVHELITTDQPQDRMDEVASKAKEEIKESVKEGTQKVEQEVHTTVEIVTTKITEMGPGHFVLDNEEDMLEVVESQGEITSFF